MWRQAKQRMQEKRETRREGSPEFFLCLHHFLWEGFPRAVSLSSHGNLWGGPADFFSVLRKTPLSSTSLLWLAKVSAPVALDKATINCGPVWRARGTKDPTRCPSPQTRLETNVTGPAQNRIIRPMSLNTFTYLRALSAACFCFIRGRRESMNGGREGAGREACDEK